MKKWLICIVITLSVGLLAALKQVSYANQKWKDAVANVKAYSQELTATKEKNTAYKLTIDQLEYLQDSIFKELNATREELGIKDKRLQSLQYVSSTFTKSDTIVIPDTIFKDPTFEMDTLIGDKWYNVHVGLKYPSEIAIRPEFKSEKHIIVSNKKETVNPPKKFFLARWFQKKHIILNVDVIEKNPYIENANSRYIEIVK